MVSRENQIKIVNILAEHEEAIGRLYTVYAEKFPAFKDFWLKLSGEESQHADWIRRIHNRIQDGSGHLNEKKFPLEVVNNSFHYIEQMVEKARNEVLDLIDALSTALYMEEALLEQKYFEVFVGDCAEITQVKYYLEEATKDHRERVKKALAENKTESK